MLSPGDNQIERTLSFFPTLQAGIHSSRGSQRGAQTISHSHWTPCTSWAGRNPCISGHMSYDRCLFCMTPSMATKKSKCKTQDPVLAIRLRAQSNFKWCRELSSEFRCLPGQTVLGSRLDWIAVWDPGQNGFQPILIIALLVVNWGSLFSIYKLWFRVWGICHFPHRKLKHLDDSTAIFQLLLNLWDLGVCNMLILCSLVFSLLSLVFWKWSEPRIYSGWPPFTRGNHSSAMQLILFMLKRSMRTLCHHSSHFMQ